MTSTEKKIFCLLVLFLVIGLTIRGIKIRNSKINFAVVPSSTEDMFHSTVSARYRNSLGKFQQNRNAIQLNQAKVEEFERISGIGPKLANAIVEYRDQKGKFSNREELLKVKGFGKKRYEKLRGLFFIDEKDLQISSNTPANHTDILWKSTDSPPISLNLATAEQLDSLPGMGTTMALKIIEYRTLNGPFKEKTDLLNISNFSIPLYNRIESYVILDRLENVD